jgi:hypothetical protein
VDLYEEFIKDKYDEYAYSVKLMELL